MEIKKRIKTLNEPPFVKSLADSTVKDLLFFMIGLLFLDIIWKLCIKGDYSYDSTVTFLGCDVSVFFDYVSRKTAYSAYLFLQALGFDSNFFWPDHIKIVGSLSSGTIVVWACTPIKQCFLWGTIMLFTRGPKWYHKLWYIPLGLLAIFYINVGRIAVISILTADKPQLFEFYHTYLFRYLFYFILFIMWYAWVLMRPKHKS